MEAYRTLQWHRVLLTGVLVWLIPFLISVPFFSPGGSILIDPGLYKSLMIVVGSGVGAALLVWYFKGITDGFLLQGVVLGVSWLLLSWALDMVVLLPLSGMDLSTYMYQIGLRYLMMPIMTTATGFCVEQALGPGGTSDTGTHPPSH